MGNPKLQRTKMAIHAAMVTRIDIEVGRVLKQLDAMGVSNDTVTLFLSDNGCSSEQLVRGDGHEPMHTQAAQHDQRDHARHKHEQVPSSDQGGFPRRRGEQEHGQGRDE